MNNLLKQAKACRYVAFFREGKCYVNLAGRYEYLELPYYISQDYEHLGRDVHPTCKEMLDAYVVPLFLERARRIGLPVPEFYITNGYFEPPVIVDSMNPFMSRSRIVLKASQQKSVAKSLTRNFTYAATCQDIPPDGTIRYFRSVLGWCVAPKYREISALIWEAFRIPLARVRVIVMPDGRILLSRIAQLLFKDLKHRELEHLEKRVTWDE